MLAAAGITDEGAVALDGDMPRYLMNGVFIRDAIADLPWRAPFAYAEHYYSRYPALSLGHHPFLPAFAQVPFYFAFGISVFSARLSVLAALAVALWFWFELIRERYDTPTAFFASLLLISTPGWIPFFQVVLSEPFALCLIILSVYAMHRYCVTGRGRDAAVFAVGVVLSGYAKQLAVLMFPVYAFQFVSAYGIRPLFRRSTLLVIAAIGTCLIPLVAQTLNYSQFNVMIVTDFVKQDRVSAGNAWRFVPGMWRGQLALTTPLLALVAISTVGAAFRRDRRILLFAFWVAAVLFGLMAVGVNNDRFYCYWLPAFAALGAGVMQLSRRTAWRALCAFALVGVVAYQLTLARRPIDPASVESMSSIRPAGGVGYEEAARYVVERPRGDTVLYSAAIDSGYFVFFVRKHDPNRAMIVLRADKILTTSRMRILDFGRRIDRPDEILPILRRYGVGYVVIEDRDYPEGPLRWLQDAVRTSDFERRIQIPIKSLDRRLANATLSVHEFMGSGPADPDASISIDVPLMGDRILVPIADLLSSRPDR